MQLTSQSFAHEGPIPSTFAFGKIDPETHVAFSDNKNPHLAWDRVPSGCRTFALVCTDPDAPSVGDDVNQEGRTVSADLPRTDFHHWALVDIPGDCREIAAGSCSDGVTKGGKQDPPAPFDARQGVNDYTSWFAGDPDMKGEYLGYDGPGPPWNDERVHRYHFRLFALDIQRCAVDAGFTADDVLKAIDGHVLAEARLTGTYTLNPDL